MIGSVRAACAWCGWEFTCPTYKRYETACANPCPQCGRARMVYNVKHVRDERAKLRAWCKAGWA